MERLSNRLTGKLVQLQIIKEGDKELYAYGFWQGAVLLFNFATVIGVGLIFGMLWQTITFMVSYGLLRPFAGGYHARTQRNCYLFSIMLIVAALILIKSISWTSWMCCILLSIAGVVIFLLAPIEDENKPLDEKEQVVFRDSTRIVLLILVGLSLILVLLKQGKIVGCIAIALMAMAIMLILGKIKNSLHSRI
jgi:accessory gene regulator B